MTDDNTDTETPTRNVIVSEFMTLDGVMQDPGGVGEIEHGGWSFQFDRGAPVTSLGGSAVVLSGRVWINPNKTSYAPLVAEFTEAVKKRFDAEGIGMPYPYTELTGGIDIENAGEIEQARADD